MFLLDIKYDYGNSQIIKWIKDKNCRPVRETYYPKIYVAHKAANVLTPVDKPILLSLPGVKDAYFEEKFLLNGKKEKVICLNVEGNQVYNIASILEEKCQLYNIDIDIIRKYLLEKNLFPTAKLKNYDLDDKQFSLDYEFPDIKSVDLIIKEENKKGIRNFNDKISCIIFGETIIEGEESDIIHDLNHLIRKTDPDLILTEGGDSFELEFLYHRSSLYNINLRLGRDKDIFKNSDRSYFSYGRILYKPRMHLLSGRLHIDRSSFLFREGRLSGLIDISRITGIPLQECSRLSPGSAITALQVNYALKNNIIIPWRRYNAEYWKTAEELLKADRGALVLEPKVGIHENVYELDFSSMFPNIMTIHNISPETVLCDCCPDSSKRVPFIGYNICEKHIGLVPMVLKPLIERRMEYKRRKKLDKLRSQEYENKQNILKWLLVTSFGYMGFNKAIFGRIESHESITAYARDILLRSIEIADDSGYDILHGIVDCMWVKGDNPEKLCEIITKEVGIELDLKGRYNWIVFLPNKSNKSGSINRYYGAMDNGKLKVRGIEMRQRGTPNLIRNLQNDMIIKLAEAKTIPEFYSKIPDTIKILKAYMRKVLNGCNISDLIFEIHISKNLDNYIVFNNQVAAMRQLKDNGIMIMPGQSVRYIVTDHKSKIYQKRVILPELAGNDAKYDKIKYYQYLLKAAESILLPFGYTDKILDNIIKNKIQTTLSEHK